MTFIFRKGQSIVELLVAFGLAAILLPALLTGLVTSREGKAQQLQRQQANAYVKEAMEVARSVREKGWTTFAVNGTYHPEVSGSSWILAPGAETIDGFTRRVVIIDTQRDSSGVIVSTGGTVDPSTKLVNITVSWTLPYASSMSANYYMTRYLDNLAYTQTSTADFNLGTNTSTTVVNTNGGAIELGSGGQGNWCDPNLNISALDLPKSGAANAITAIEGRAFAGTGDNASGVSFANVSITNANPPVAAVSGTFDGYKTNDIFGETNYAYLATDSNSKEIVIVDLTTNPYSEVGYVNLPRNSDATGIFVSGSVGYAVSGNKLYSFDLSSKSGSRSLLDSDGVSVSLFGITGELYVVSDYVYVTIGSYAFRELVIVDATNPSSLNVVGWADVNGEAGQEVYVNETGTRAYLATGYSSSLAEFFIVDVSTKTGSRPIISSYDTNGMNPKGVTVVTGNKAIVVGTDGEEYQVINIANETNLSRCGGLEIASGIREVSSVLEADGDAYSYIVTGDASGEFQIIAGGAGGTYSSSGNFESSTFDPGYQTAFNRFLANVIQPVNTNLLLQVASAAQVSGSCNGVNFSFAGPDKTGNTYFTSSDSATIVGSIPFDSDGLNYENPARCFRYKVFLSTSDSSSTPVFNDITINYSP